MHAFELVLEAKRGAETQESVFDGTKRCAATFKQAQLPNNYLAYKLGIAAYTVKHFNYNFYCLAAEGRCSKGSWLRRCREQLQGGGTSLVGPSPTIQA